MAKAKRMYGCTECGATFPKWAGQCPECNAWNTLVETMVETAPPSSGRGDGASRQPWCTWLGARCARPPTCRGHSDIQSLRLRALLHDARAAQ